MRILFPYMARWHAVNWTRYHSLLTKLAEKGHTVYVLQTPPLVSDETNYQEVAARNNPNIIIHDVPVNNWFWNKKMFMDKIIKKGYISYQAYKYAKGFIDKEKIDVILLYNIPQYLFTKIKNVIQVFDYADDYVDMLSYELGKLDNPMVRGFAGIILHKMMARADITLSVSYELAKQAHGNVHVLPNGVNLNEYEESKSKQLDEIKRKNIPVIGFLGSFEYFIDLDLILDTAAQLPEYIFLLVGYGRDWDHVNNRVKQEKLKNVVLTGGVPHTEINSYIDEMDICLNVFKPIPVSHRACPIKLFEYLARKKPVISTRLKELEYIDKEFIYYADTSNELTAVIKEILASEEDCKKNIEQGYNEVIRNYTWDKIAEGFEKHVKSLSV